MIFKIRKTFKKKFLKRPTQVVLEPTNRCNLNCPYCMVGMQNQSALSSGIASHSLMTRPHGVMSEDVFNEVLRNLKTFGIKKVYLHFQGEPFLNKHTPDFAQQLKKDNFIVGIFTNGQAFNDEIINKIGEVKIDLIRFSVDGASEETYQQNRVGGQFSKVYENMKKVVSACKGKNTRIEWQFLALRNNEHEIETARKMAQEIGAHFFVKGFRETDPKLLPNNPRYQAKFHSKPCTDIYYQIGIYWNGDVVPCCYDVDGNSVMGNVKEVDLTNIWNSHKYKDFRTRVDNALVKPQEEPTLCKNCLRWR